MTETEFWTTAYCATLAVYAKKGCAAKDAASAAKEMADEALKQAKSTSGIIRVRKRTKESMTCLIR